MSISMLKITPHLVFNDQAEEAAQFYVSVFKNSAILNKTYYTKKGGAFASTVRTVRFHLDGQELIAVNGGPSFTFSDGVSLYVNCETQEEIDELWEKLSAGGIKERCGWLRDRYGVYWQINPMISWEMVNDPDPEKAQRVMDAIDGMTKIEIETLKHAYVGSEKNGQL
ncbi:Glyoxalase/Bleomycin resistance protein/Dihydroxybiphenyl dioxygenase [Syntrophomonas zehnderi OL-4]|uniref:Glyoxalase/Bleomycin resistance protein/Dihydroxybiphenyl dioxygenase n=1 Tax=Syntrophomonas zehnderi OL-4 TaxID=690567 RepID=A0A0E4C7T8_9FIRM|nr:VOC family protein [Syntrophomonas zehnderi]CFX13612.1 Glyoxalase/Bleomycin resistance protein/Dihydroxybiphenyl dioxygenase [Syntrophomonas zehnderi OL-4]